MGRAAEVTIDQVAAAIRDLTTEGVPVTLTNLRERVGGGFPVVRRLWKELQARPPDPSSPALTTDAIQGLKPLFEQLWAAAVRQAAGRYSEAQVLAQRTAAAQEAEIEKMTNLLEQAATREEALIERLAVSEATAQASAAAAAEAAAQTEQARMALEARIIDEQQAREQDQAAAASQLEQITAERDQALHFRDLAAQGRAAAEQELQRYGQLLDEYRKSRDDLHAAARASRAEQERLAADLAKQEGVIEDLRMQNRVLLESLRSLSETNSAHQERIKELVTRMREAFDERTKRPEDVTVSNGQTKT